MFIIFSVDQPKIPTTKYIYDFGTIINFLLFKIEQDSPKPWFCPVQMWPGGTDPNRSNLEVITIQKTQNHQPPSWLDFVQCVELWTLNITMTSFLLLRHLVESFVSWWEDMEQWLRLEWQRTLFEGNHCNLHGRDLRSSGTTEKMSHDWRNHPSRQKTASAPFPLSIASSLVQPATRNVYFWRVGSRPVPNEVCCPFCPFILHFQDLSKMPLGKAHRRDLYTHDDERLANMHALVI